MLVGKLNLDEVIQKVSVLRSVDTRSKSTPPYPFGGGLDIPTDWGYMYMGALNHFFVREIICEKTQLFINTLLNNGGRSWHIFDAVAWFCMAQQCS